MQKQTPPHIKWLLVERATVAGNIAFLEQNIERVQSELALARASLDSLDKTIHFVDGRLNAQAAGRIRAFRGSYGRRGALKEFVKSLIDSHPEGIRTVDIGHAVIQEFALVLSSKAEYSSYMTTSIKSTISKLRDVGAIENVSTVRGKGSLALWRVRRDVRTFDDLRREESSLAE